MTVRLPSFLFLAYAAVAASQEYCPEGSQCDMGTEESDPSNLNLLQVGLSLKQQKEEKEIQGVDLVETKHGTPRPSKATLVLESPHDRYDPSPAYAAAGFGSLLLSNTTTESEAGASLPAGVALARRKRARMQAHSFFKGSSSSSSTTGSKSLSGDLKHLYERKGSSAKGFLIKATHGICLDASQRNSNGGKVHMWGCNSNNQNQQWGYHKDTGLIKATHGKCLDASQRSSNGGKVHMWDCNQNNKNQQWYVQTNGLIKAVHGICLDASQRNSNGGKVHMWGCSANNNNQKWDVAVMHGGSGRRRDVSGSKNVKSGFLGKAVWRRYDTNELPDHSLIHSAQEAVNILADAPDAAEGTETDTSGGKAVFAKLTNSNQRNSMKSAANNIKGRGVNACQHDVYVSQLIGQNSGGGRRRQVFGPGLNSLWLIFDQSHNTLLGHIVVGASASGDPSAAYPGIGANNYMEATMSFIFTDFSSSSNPIHYKVQFDSGGAPELTMLIKHHQNNAQYGNFRVKFKTPGSSSVPNANKFQSDWRHTNSVRDFNTNLFVNKAFQVYEICHCYHSDPGRLWQCLMSDGKNDFWTDIMGYMVKWFVDLLVTPSDDWYQRPHYQESGGAWKKCWDHKPSPFAIALASAITIVNGIVTVVEDAIEIAKAVGDAVVNTAEDVVDFIGDTAADVGEAILGEVFGIGSRRRKGWFWLQDSANRTYVDVVTIDSDNLGNEVHKVMYGSAIETFKAKEDSDRHSDIEGEEVNA